ncbi:MAG TPA: DUF4375 domain-containing protein [Arenimonas sp.]|uniref:DMP19 family protein n=1 Tax=Arenimonas sp. TaxID=1872635 RepID=UPI002D7ED2F7|nr:DUF4375 domain-containing protein [Arenimonas sp.]HEU0154169.1 DUF4375 domain-containing protein [Arenimonas sp.]
MDKNAFLIQLSESDRTDHGRVEFSAQSQPQQVFSAIWALESEVTNGGFGSFFENEDPALVAFAAEALKIIGATKCSDIVRRAIPAGPEQRDDFDAEFYEYPDNLTELLFSFVSSNPAEFGAASIRG